LSLALAERCQEPFLPLHVIPEAFFLREKVPDTFFWPGIEAIGLLSG
jgi:hypothetical protein